MISFTSSLAVSALQLSSALHRSLLRISCCLCSHNELRGRDCANWIPNMNTEEPCKRRELEQERKGRGKRGQGVRRQGHSSGKHQEPSCLLLLLAHRGTHQERPWSSGSRALILISRRSIGSAVSAPCEIRRDTFPRRRHVLSHSSPPQEDLMGCAGSVRCLSSLVRGKTGPIGDHWTVSDLCWFLPLHCWGRWPHG